MIVNVEPGYPAHFPYFRLRWRKGYEFVRGERWTRKVATETLDLLEKVYGLRRRSIRFRHR